MNHKKVYAKDILKLGGILRWGSVFVLADVRFGSMCSAQANARDMCKIKMIVDRARIGSTLPS